MATIVNDADVALQATSPRLVPVTLPTNLIIPAIKAIKLSAPGYVFGVSSAGANPSSILLTAALVQVTGTISFSVISGTATLTSVTSTTATLLYSNMTTSTVTIRAQVTESGITYTSDVSIAKVVDGASAATAYLAQAQNLAAPAVSPNPTTGSAVPSGWSATLVSPTAGQSLWSIDGTYVATTNQTTWSAPYLTQGIPTTIQSDNFVAGVSGWRIKRDTGDVEFGTGTFRGDVVSAGKAQFSGSFTGASGFNTAGEFNYGGASAFGLMGFSPVSGTGVGVYGAVTVGAASGSAGVQGTSSGTAGIGVQGIADATGVGVHAIGDSSAGTGIALKMVGKMQWGLGGNGGTFLTWALPPNLANTVLASNGTWKDISSGIKLISSGNATAGAALGYLVIDTFGAAGQVKIPYYAL